MREVLEYRVRGFDDRALKLGKQTANDANGRDLLFNWSILRKTVVGWPPLPNPSKEEREKPSPVSELCGYDFLEPL